jgi:hypothetical protein
MTDKSNHLIPNTFQTPNGYIDEILPYLTGNEFKVLLFAVRHIYGFRQYITDNKREISISMFCNGYASLGGTGLSRGTVIKILKRLEDFGLLIRVDTAQGETQWWSIGTNPDFDKIKSEHSTRKTSHKKQIEKARKQLVQLNNTSTVEQTATSTVEQTATSTVEQTEINPSSKPTLETKKDSASADIPFLDDDATPLPSASDDTGDATLLPITDDDGFVFVDDEPDYVLPDGDLPETLSADERKAWQNEIAILCNYEPGTNYSNLNRYINILRGTVPETKAKSDKPHPDRKHQLSPAMSMRELKAFSIWAREWYEQKDRRSVAKLVAMVDEWRGIQQRLAVQWEQQYSFREAAAWQAWHQKQNPEYYNEFIKRELERMQV